MVCIGDRWCWGDAVLEVTQPRAPCFKPVIHGNRGDIGRLLTQSGRYGWYLRVLEPGRVPVAGPMLLAPHAMAATVTAAHRALWSRETRSRCSKHSWRRALALEEDVPWRLGLRTERSVTMSFGRRWAT